MNGHERDEIKALVEGKKKPQFLGRKKKKETLTNKISSGLGDKLH